MRAEWSFARSLLSRYVLANVLARKVEAGEYSRTFALEVAQAMLHDNPARLSAR